MLLNHSRQIQRESLLKITNKSTDISIKENQQAIDLKFDPSSFSSDTPFKIYKSLFFTEVHCKILQIDNSSVIFCNAIVAERVEEGQERWKGGGLDMGGEVLR